MDCPHKLFGAATDDTPLDRQVAGCEGMVDIELIGFPTDDGLQLPHVVLEGVPCIEGTARNLLLSPTALQLNLVSVQKVLGLEVTKPHQLVDVLWIF